MSAPIQKVWGWLGPEGITLYWLGTTLYWPCELGFRVLVASSAAPQDFTAIIAGATAGKFKGQFVAGRPVCPADAKARFALRVDPTCTQAVFCVDDEIVGPFATAEKSAALRWLEVQLRLTAHERTQGRAG